jgi:hypothetical protein
LAFDFFCFFAFCEGIENEKEKQEEKHDRKKREQTVVFLRQHRKVDEFSCQHKKYIKLK